MFSERGYEYVELWKLRDFCAIEKKKKESNTGNGFWLFTRHNTTLHNLLSFILFSKETDLTLKSGRVEGNKWGSNIFHNLIFPWKSNLI